MTCLSFASDSTYLLGGTRDWSDGARGEYLIMKLAANGTLLWQDEIGPDNDIAYLKDFQQTPDGGYILGGSSNAEAGGDQTEDAYTGDYWIVKLNAAREVEWDNVIGTPRMSPTTNGIGGSYEDLTSLLQMPDGGYLLGGMSSSNALGDQSESSKGWNDFWIVKIDSVGKVVWDKTIGSPDNEFLTVMSKTSDGGIVLGGNSFTGFGQDEYTPLDAGSDKSDSTSGPSDIWIVKMMIEQPPLPVTLTSFTAQKENTTALLTWSTASETHSDRFEVQRSLNGKNWNVIASVRANGDVNELSNYRFVDDKPMLGSDNLYRLKMIDTDDTFTYSKIESQHFDQHMTLTIFPNPAAEILNIEMEEWRKVKSVELLNNRSMVVYHSGEKPVQSINIKALPTGLYVLRIKLRDGSYSTRKVLVRN